MAGGRPILFRIIKHKVSLWALVGPGASIPPEIMMHFPPLLQIFLPIFENFLDFLENFLHFTFSRKNFPFSSAKISDDLFLVINHKFRISPLFCLFYCISPSDSRKFIIPPYFSKSPPVFEKFNSFLHTLRVISPPPTLTMMHLCITQCTCPCRR